MCVCLRMSLRSCLCSCFVVCVWLYTSMYKSISAFEDRVIIDIFSNMSLTHTRLIILGDFNLWSNGNLGPAFEDLLQSCENLNLKQLVMESTHQGGHTLDLIFSAKNVADLEGILLLCWTDHYLIKFLVFNPRMSTFTASMENSC